ncbi:MAG: GDSL-type esterase/lipase family protein, partial [Akkermansiaceae bacterium]
MTGNITGFSYKPLPPSVFRRIGPAVAGFFACCWLVALASAEAGSVRILPLGDSITRGSNSNGDIPGGYRKELAHRLALAQLSFDFVGNRSDNFASGTDPHHNGINSQTTANILSQLSGVLALDPDIVLLHIGTNDVLQGISVNTAANNLSSLIDQITTGKQTRQLYVSTIIPILQGFGNRTQTELNAAVDAYNIEVRSRVAQFVSQGRNVRLVDMSVDLDYNDFFDSGDWIHPGQVGCARMGASWHAAVTADGTLLQAPPAGAPSAPDSLVATVISSERINVSWADQSPDETGFEVHAKSATGGLWVRIGSPAANQTIFSATGLTAGVDRWYFRVRAVNAAGASSWSHLAASIPVELAQGKPASASSIFGSAYSAIKANDGDSWSVWVSASNDPQASWTVDLGTDYRLQDVQLVTRQDFDQPTTRNHFEIRASTTSDFSSYTVLASRGETPLAYRSTLSAGIALTSPFRYLRVAKTDGRELTLAELRVFGSVPPPVPAAPSGLTATATGGTQIALQWADHSSTEIGFLLERKSDAEGAFGEIATLPANATGFIDSGLSPETGYTYRLRATNGVDVSAYSAQASVTTGTVRDYENWAAGFPDFLALPQSEREPLA